MASGKTETSIVFVPGMASVGSVVYAPLVKALTSVGHSADSLHVINNTSVVENLTKAPNFGGNALQTDIDQIRSLLQKLITEQQRDVLIVAHSYGGTPALYATSGLWKHQRSSADKAGGVTKIALIASSLTLPGSSVAADRAEWQKANGHSTEEGGNVEVIDGEVYLKPAGLEHVWMNDITEETFRNSLRPAALSSAMSPTPSDLDSPENWRLAYLILTELDLAMPEALQRHLIKRARDAGGQVDDGTLKSGHFAQISHADEVAEWVRQLI